MQNEDLIAYARDHADALRHVFPNDSEVRDDTRLIDRLADALEAVIANRDEFRAAWNVLGFKIDRLEDERDAALAVIEKARDVVRPGSSVPLGVSEARHWDRLLAESHRILSSVPADVLRERDATRWDEGFTSTEGSTT